MRKKLKTKTWITTALHTSISIETFYSKTSMNYKKQAKIKFSNKSFTHFSCYINEHNLFSKHLHR